jgi:hypothetical protein
MKKYLSWEDVARGLGVTRAGPRWDYSDISNDVRCPGVKVEGEERNPDVVAPHGGPYPGILFPCNGDSEVQRDDEAGLFASDEAAAEFLSAMVGIPYYEEDGRFFLKMPNDAENLERLWKVCRLSWADS